MKFLIIVKATADSEAGAKPSPDMWDAMGKFNDELAAERLAVELEGFLAAAVKEEIGLDVHSVFS